MLSRACTSMLLLLAVSLARRQNARRVGGMQEVFAWKQLTYNINGNIVLRDRLGETDDTSPLDEGNTRNKQQSEIVFDDNDSLDAGSYRPTRPTRTTTSTTRPANQSGSFFIQYNNLPMGVERVGDRVFVTVPGRRYGIPSTLNYLDLKRDSKSRSPPLRPYPNLRLSRELTSVYRTRADQCGRLWMVDTGLLEIPNNPQQMRPPAIVVYDLSTDRQILRYPFKSTDLISEATPTGLASITVDIQNDDCSGAYAYVPDLTTYGLIVYSLRDNDSWRLRHNYFSFNPLAGNLNIAGQSFQWSDGIFSITLGAETSGGCRATYFHSMAGTHEFTVSTCVLRNRTASEAADYYKLYSVVGDRGPDGQSTVHGYHAGSQVVFFSDIARDGVSCWYTALPLTPGNVVTVARDSATMSYPSDLHVTGDEVWVMANSLPTWAYSTLDTDQYNFFIYKANVYDLIAGTACERRQSNGGSYNGLKY